MLAVLTFLTLVIQIQSEAPRYKLGGFGLNGICDCIGLIKGALKRGGAGWGKTHGSNYALRYEMRKTFTIKKAADLYPGLAVYKYRNPGDAKYKLPSSYAKHPDQRDYYHVGVVLSVNPLKIAHCTSWTGGSGIKVDTTLGTWKIAGELSRVDYTAIKLPAPANPFPLFKPMRTLRYTAGQAYMRGDDVTQLQHELIRLGYSVGGHDGIYGPRTQAAVRSFQINTFPGQPKEWDGIVGAKTWSKLGVS